MKNTAFAIFMAGLTIVALWAAGSAPPKVMDFGSIQVHSDYVLGGLLIVVGLAQIGALKLLMSSTGESRLFWYMPGYFSIMGGLLFFSRLLFGIT